MTFADRLYGLVDFTFLRCSWPQCEEEQHALLRHVDPKAWRRSGGYGVEDYLVDHRNNILAKLAIQTRFGHRWFHVWRDPVNKNLVMQGIYTYIYITGANRIMVNQNPVMQGLHIYI